MVDRGRYFSMFAPRQSGKSTFIEEIYNQLHQHPTYLALKLDFQSYRNISKSAFYSEIERYFYRKLIDRLTDVKCENTDAIQKFLSHHHLVDHISFKFLFDQLNQLLPFKKMVVLIDEFEGTPVSELMNFLTVIRSLYQENKDVKQKALYSVGLVGLRDMTKLLVDDATPFDFADTIVLPPFSLKNVRDLYAQYSEETNQPFTDEAVKKIQAETNGQTWLVNRLGTILTVNIKPGTIEPITENDVDMAIERLLYESNAHFHNLFHQAKVYKDAFDRVISGDSPYMPENEDQRWLELYGLIKNENGYAVIANNIYKKRFS